MNITVNVSYYLESYDSFVDAHESPNFRTVHQIITNFLATVAFLLRFMCIIIYCSINIKKRARINVYLAFHSFVEAFLSFNNIILPHLKCKGNTCIFNSYISNILYVYLQIFGSSVAGTLGILLNTAITADRYLLIFSRFKHLYRVFNFKIIIPILVFLSFAINFHYLFILRIESSSEDDQVHYHLERTDFSNTSISAILRYISFLLRYILFVFVFLFLNGLLMYRSYKYARKRKTLAQTNVNVTKIHTMLHMSYGTKLLEDKEEDYDSDKNSGAFTDGLDDSQVLKNSEWNLTKLTVFIGCLFTIQLIFICFHYLITRFLSIEMNSIESSSVLDRMFTFYYVLEIVTLNLIQVISIIEVVSYYVFNKHFRSSFRKIFLRK